MQPCSRINGLADVQQFVRVHSGTEYWAASLGFWPGLAFLMPLDPRCRLTALKCEHRDLDAMIVQLALQPSLDELELKRLKKRKLQLKDAIALLESRLIPDLDA